MCLLTQVDQYNGRKTVVVVLVVLYNKVYCQLHHHHHFITALCYVSAVLAMALCLSACLSVRPSQIGVLLKRLNVGSHKQHRTIAQGL